jgi:hydrogenase expression/formation protein HypC
MCLAIPGRIMSIDAETSATRTGWVNFSGAVTEINLSCVPEAQVNDYVIVHAGCALATLDEAEAREVLACLSRLDELVEGAIPT